jgi:thymidylate synthase
MTSGRYPLNQAWRWLLHVLLAEGRVVKPRGLSTYELPQLTLVVDATDPVLTIKERKLNHRFMAAEAYWILTGDDRAETIVPYNSKLANFSDDGRRFFGAYGPPFIEQLGHVLRTLLLDRDSRQAMITLWRPSPRPTLDPPCLGGNTLIPSPEGDITIRQLARQFELGLTRYPVFSFNQITKSIQLAWCTAAWKTGVKSVKRFTFDDGSSFKTTDDHIFFVKRRRKEISSKKHASTTFIEQVQAKFLVVGDRVLATTFIKKGKQRRPAYIKQLNKQNWSYTNQQMVHLAYDEFLHGSRLMGIDVHHKDKNVENNKAENLERLTHEHHARLKMIGNKNPMRHESLAANRRRRKRTSSSMRQAWQRDRTAWPQGRTNHKIVKIEQLGETEVFDLTIPNLDTVVVGTGVVVHNCTIAAGFQIRDNHVNTHVFMRSSDAWLGVPYDCFNFCAMSYYVTALLGDAALSPGTLYLTMASSHLYETNREVAETCLNGSLPYNLPVPEVLYTNAWVLLGRLADLREKGNKLAWWTDEA